MIQGKESAISRLADVAMVTELGRDVIVPWLIQTWQAPITPPLVREEGRERAGVTGRRKVKKWC